MYLLITAFSFYLHFTQGSKFVVFFCCFFTFLHGYVVFVKCLLMYENNQHISIAHASTLYAHPVEQEAAVSLLLSIDSLHDYWQ